MWHPGIVHPYGKRNAVQTKYGIRVVMSGHKYVDRLLSSTKENRFDLDTMIEYSCRWANHAGETYLLRLLLHSSLSTGRHLLYVQFASKVTLMHRS